MVEADGVARAFGAGGRTGQTGDGAHDARGGNQADRVVAGVGDVNVARRIDGEAGRTVKARIFSGAVGAAVEAHGAGECADGAGWSDDADRVVAGVGDVEVVGAIDRDTLGIAKERNGAGAIGAAGFARDTGECRDDAGRSYFANGVVRAIDDKDVAGAVEGDAVRLVETGGAAGAVGAAVVPRAAGEGGDDAGGGDFADRVVFRIGDKNISAGVGGDAGRADLGKDWRAEKAVRGDRHAEIKRRGAARAVGAPGVGKAGDRVDGFARDGGDDAGERDFADRAVHGVGDVKIAVGVDEDAAGAVEARRGAGGVGAAASVGRAGDRGAGQNQVGRLGRGDGGEAEDEE